MSGNDPKPSVPIKINGLNVGHIGSPNAAAPGGNVGIKPVSGFGGNVVGFAATNQDDNDTTTADEVIQEPPAPEEKVDNFATAGATLANTVPAPGAQTAQEAVEEQPTEMDFQVVSDLHLEGSLYGPDRDIPRTGKFLVLAGDIGNCIRDPDRSRYRAWLARHCVRFPRVFVILGNNEPKGNGPHADGWETAIACFRAWATDPDMMGRLTFLENNMYDLSWPHSHDVIVLGCTLWSRIRQSQSTAGSNDARTIKSWSPQKNNEVFESSYSWLKKQVNEIRKGVRASAKILVITHHAPCFGTSVPSQDKNGTTWSAFQNDILGGEGVEGLGKGDVWVFGHTHFCCDIFRDEVRVYSNQRGRGAGMPGYDAGKFITI